MTDRDKIYAVANKATVWNVAQEHLMKHERIPTVADLRPHFETPQSPAIAVYFQEWKQGNEDLIRLHKGGKETWKRHALKLESEVELLNYKLNVMEEELTGLKDWLAADNPTVLEDWESLNEEEDAALCKAL